MVSANKGGTGDAIRTFGDNGDGTVCSALANRAVTRSERRTRRLMPCCWPVCVEHMAEYCKFALPFLALLLGWWFHADGKDLVLGKESGTAGRA